VSSGTTTIEKSTQGRSQNRKRNPWALLISIIVNIIVLFLIGIVGFLSWNKFINKNDNALLIHPASNEIKTEPTSTPSVEDPSNQISLSPLQSNVSFENVGISRSTMLSTTIPTRPSDQIVTYTVQTGDTLFTIADVHKIKPETLLWGNYDVLQDNPHLLKPGQVLNVLPVNGTYYQWVDGDTVDKVASYFKTTPEDIISFTGNNIDLTKLSEKNSGIEPGKWLMIPNGRRAIKDWGPPAITRSNPASASYYGSGSCGSVYEGAVGTGSFVWPTTDHTISGYTYDSNVHPGIDIAGQEGNPVFAADTGVVVYAGWSDFGYGYLLVIDHGNGNQTAYAHLLAVGASCGQSVIRGGQVGSLGSTGNSTGPHLHFEIIINGVKVNPLGYVQ
jgi:murein DD-endopeptidase MepM/ murein hydrolase activator NlpD